MNCQDFEAIVDDLARDEMMEVSAREGALAHAAACSPCAERLAGERALAADLRALTQADEVEEAPLRLEVPLVAAFRGQTATSPASHRASPRSHWRKRAAVGAVAASIALIVALTILAVMHRGSPGREVPRPARQTRPTRPAAAPVLAKVVKPGAPPAPDTAQGARRTVASSSVRAAGPTKTERAEEAEVATDFLPLPYGDTLTTLEGSRLVRIRLSHSALTTFGLAVNQDRRGELIQADVLLGEDGLARAIRFVR